jgi:CBS domain-containing protein
LLAQHLMIKDVITVTRNVSIRECIELLSKRHIGSLVIVDEAQRCEGIFTERDAIRVVAQNIPLDAPIEKVMIRNVHTINEDTSFDEVKRIMKFYKIRHLPVVDDAGRLVGLISLRYILDQLTGLM